MKTGTPDHLKTKRLRRLLGVPICTAVGVLNMVWDITSRNAWKGDIGKFSNEEIADALEWSGDANELIKALIEARWIDEVDDSRRLVVHDWYEHCPDYIRKRIDRQNAKDVRQREKVSANGGQTRTTSDNVGQRDETSENGALGKARQVQSNQGKSSEDPPNPPGGGGGKDSPTKPKRKPVSADDCTYPDAMDTPEVRESVSKFLAMRRRIRKSVTSPDPVNGHLVKFSSFGRDGPRMFVESVDESCLNEWQGIFPRKGKPKQSGIDQTLESLRSMGDDSG